MPPVNVYNAPAEEAIAQTCKKFSERFLVD